jgi:hypothetical protein
MVIMLAIIMIEATRRLVLLVVVVLVVLVRLRVRVGHFDDILG